MLNIWTERKVPKNISIKINFYLDELMNYPINFYILGFLETKIRDFLEDKKQEEEIDSYKINIYENGPYYPIGTLIIVFIVLNEINKTYCLIKRKIDN